MSDVERHEALERLLEGDDDGLARQQPAAGADADLRDLARLGRWLHETAAAAPAIDETAVWRRVAAGMAPRPSAPWWRSLRAGKTRLVASGLVAAALAVLMLGAGLLRTEQSASAAFITEFQAIARASDDAALRGEIAGDERAQLERRALALLAEASRPGVLSALNPQQAADIHARLVELRAELVALLGEGAPDAETVTALNAVAGLLEAAHAIAPSVQSPLAQSNEAARARGGETDSGQPAPAAVATGTGEPRGESRPSNSGSSSSAESWAQPPQSNSGGDTRGTARAQEVGSAVGSAVAKCARTFDRDTLSSCNEEAARALRQCATVSNQESCRAGVAAAVSAAQQRVQRLEAGCQRLPNAQSRDACAQVTSRGNSGGEQKGSERRDESGNSSGRTSSGGDENRGSGSDSQHDSDD